MISSKDRGKSGIELYDFVFYVLTKNDQNHNLNLLKLENHKFLDHIEMHQKFDIFSLDVSNVHVFHDDHGFVVYFDLMVLYLKKLFLIELFVLIIYLHEQNLMDLLMY